VHSVKHIFNTDGYLKSCHKTQYRIPEYQRGYKWSKTEVTKLLVDIDKFKQENGKFYCLQNITLVPNTDGNSLNVVDGQQRLTTLAVLLSRLGFADLVTNKLIYAVRPETHTFLTTYITGAIAQAPLDFTVTWPNPALNNKDFNRQDIFYLYETVNTVDNWLANKKPEEKVIFKQKVLNDVKLIVNKIDSDAEEKIFGNLNSKRIPLDGADLVRAVLITRVANDESEKAGDIKNIVRVNERRVRIGWELDEINAWWSQDEVRGFFKMFIKNKVEGDVEFDLVKYPVNNLLLLFAAKDSKNLSLDLVEDQESALKFYKELTKMHHTLKDWYQDKHIYHFLGYLFSQTGVTFKVIFENWLKSTGRKEFISALLKDIRLSIFGNDEVQALFDKTEDWYADTKLLVKILLALDIESSMPEYRKNLPYGAFVKGTNDIEHIFPQNPEKITEKKEYIEYLNKYGLSDVQFDLSEFEERQDNITYQEDMELYIINQMALVDINSIGNLVLLDYSINRSIGRISYARKRAVIIKHFNKGDFIQPHTFKVFARYFVDGDNESRDLERWTDKDIEENCAAIITTLTNFFNPPN